MINSPINRFPAWAVVGLIQSHYGKLRLLEEPTSEEIETKTICRKILNDIVENPVANTNKDYTEEV